MCCHPICFHNLVKFIAEHNKRDKNLSTITVKKDHRGECAYYSSDDRAGQRKPRPRSDKPNNRGILILPASRWPPIVRARRDSHREIIIYDFNALDVLYFFFFSLWRIVTWWSRALTRRGSERQRWRSRKWSEALRISSRQWAVIDLHILEMG